MIMLQKLVIEITNFFAMNAKNSSEKDIVGLLKSVPLGKENFVSRKIKKIPKERALKKALSTISDNALKEIKDCISNAYFEIEWKIDSGLFYEKDAEVGKQYLNGNMHSEIIGPDYGSFKSDELRLGLFLLEPNVFYPDHQHKAPELYLNLTGGTQWRFESTVWRTKNAGSVIYNQPFRVHAMKTTKFPFLSVWCWPSKSAEKCIIVPRCP